MDGPEAPLARHGMPDSSKVGKAGRPWPGPSGTCTPKEFITSTCKDKDKKPCAKLSHRLIYKLHITHT